MEIMLEIRETIINIYKRFEFIIIPALKFILGFIVFSMINGIGNVAPEIGEILKPSYMMPLNLLFALFFTVLPISVSYALMTLCITLQFTSSYEVAAIVAIALLLVVFFYGRISGKEGCLILFTILGYYFKLPYLVPFIAGMYFGIKSIIPVSIGVFLWEFAPLAFGALSVERPKVTSLLDIPDNFVQVLTFFLDAVKENNNWAVTAFAFCLVIAVVHVCSHLPIDFSKEISIAMGLVVNIVTFIFLSIAFDYEISIGSMIFGSLVCAILMAVIKFFDIVLDYQRAEQVEFEDEENYYYVKVIPKIVLTQREGGVKKIRESAPAPSNPVRRGRKASPLYEEEESDDEIGDRHLNNYLNNSPRRGSAAKTEYYNDEYEENLDYEPEEYEEYYEDEDYDDRYDEGYDEKR